MVQYHADLYEASPAAYKSQPFQEMVLDCPSTKPLLQMHPGDEIAMGKGVI
jgi:hypothetical protein